MNLLIHTRVPLTYGDIFVNYLNPTIKTQKVRAKQANVSFDDHTKVVYITYTMANQDLPDIYAHALGPRARVYTVYQANPSWPCHNYYIYLIHETEQQELRNVNTIHACT